jgi:hypothetical protein
MATLGCGPLADPSNIKHGADQSLRLRSFMLPAPYRTAVSGRSIVRDIASGADPQQFRHRMPPSTAAAGALGRAVAMSPHRPPAAGTRTQRRKCAPHPFFLFSRPVRKWYRCVCSNPCRSRCGRSRRRPQWRGSKPGRLAPSCPLPGTSGRESAGRSRTKQNTLMVLARCDLTRWCRYREPALAALREVEPYLRATHADWRAGHDKKAECAARARAAKAHKRLTQAAAADRSSTARRKSGPHLSAASRGADADAHAAPP